MKFTSEQLIKAIGLKEEDVIICLGAKYIVRENKLICKDEQDGIGLDIIYGIDYLLDKDFEILHPKKKLGEKLCKNTLCDNCPLCKITCMYRYYKTLYEVLDNWYEKYNDKEIYDILKARLDKEVE